MLTNIKPVVKNALPTRPKYRESNIADKKPNNGKKIISRVIFSKNFLKLKFFKTSEEEGFEPTKRNSR